MSEKKIIIRNCPNITFIDFWRLDKSKSSYCKLKNCGCENYTDCLLKKIVEKCKAERDLRPDANIDDDFAVEILDLLDIQEVE